MILKWKGWQGKRIVGSLVWSAETDYKQKVEDLNLVAELLTEPGSGFSVDESDPLAQQYGVEKAAEMALAGKQNQPEEEG